MPKANPPIRLARVLRADPGKLILQHSDGEVCVRAHAEAGIDTGDLVSWDGAAVRLVRTNQSQRPFEEQDWWTLLQKAPALRARAVLRRRIREYFDTEHFLELEPPTLSKHASLEVHLQSITAQVGTDVRFLPTSPEYHLKRALSAGFERIYAFGTAYRDDESGAHHHPEFTMLEWYRTLQPVHALMDDVRALVEIATGCSRVWQTLTVRDALQRYSKPTDNPLEIVERLVTDIEPVLKEMGAVFLTEYPASLASLAAIDPANPSVSLRFEAYIDGIELANGFGELVCPNEQRQRFMTEQAERRAHGLPVHAIDERFIDALSAGLPPCSGIALGFDRLLMLALKKPHIDDVTLFPPSLA